LKCTNAACAVILCETIHAGGGALVCCEKRYSVDENTLWCCQKHVPVITKLMVVIVTIGSVAHPMEEKHYIEWLSCSQTKAYRQFLAWRSSWSRIRVTASLLLLVSCVSFMDSGQLKADFKRSLCSGSLEQILFYIRALHESFAHVSARETYFILYILRNFSLFLLGISLLPGPAYGAPDQVNWTCCNLGVPLLMSVEWFLSHSVIPHLHHPHGFPAYCSPCIRCSPLTMK
jgi:desulfoferrodoxin